VQEVNPAYTGSFLVDTGSTVYTAIYATGTAVSAGVFNFTFLLNDEPVQGGNQSISVSAGERLEGTGGFFSSNAPWGMVSHIGTLGAPVAVTVTGDSTLKLQGDFISSQPQQHTVTFDANGGTEVTEIRLVNDGASLDTLPTTTLTGYTFEGWYTAASGGSAVTASTAITTSMTLYARWATAPYTITYDANGGTALLPESKQVLYSNPIGELPTPVREGYVFKGWYLATTGGTELISTTRWRIAEDRTIYARWASN
jgi:uncharacterized repeat protein (TIGR02543 family)